MLDAIVRLGQIRMWVEARVKKGNRDAASGEFFIGSHAQRRRQNAIFAIAENPVADSGETRMCLAKEFQTGIAHAIRRLPLWYVRIDEPGEGRVKIVKQLCIRAQANRASSVFRQDDSSPPKQIFADDLSVDERPNFVNCFRLACRCEP